MSSSVFLSNYSVCLVTQLTIICIQQQTIISKLHVKISTLLQWNRLVLSGERSGQRNQMCLKNYRDSYQNPMTIFVKSLPKHHLLCFPQNTLYKAFKLRPPPFGHMLRATYSSFISELDSKQKYF